MRRRGVPQIHLLNDAEYCRSKVLYLWWDVAVVMKLAHCLCGAESCLLSWANKDRQQPWRDILTASLRSL